MPYHYSKAEEMADALLPWRWQAQTIEQARKLVAYHFLDCDEELLGQAADFLYRRRGRIPE